MAVRAGVIVPVPVTEYPARLRAEFGGADRLDWSLLALHVRKQSTYDWFPSPSSNNFFDDSSQISFLFYGYIWRFAASASKDVPVAPCSWTCTWESF
jgi:hypothetical protein